MDARSRGKTLGSFSKPWRLRRVKRRQTKGLMRKTIAVHVHLNLCTFLCRPLRNNNVKWLSSMYFGEREPQWLIFGNFFRNWTPSVHVKPEQVLRPIGVLKRFTQLRDSNVKHKFIFYKASSAPSPSPLLKLPNRRQGDGGILSPKSAPGAEFPCSVLKKLNIRCLDKPPVPW